MANTQISWSGQETESRDSRKSRAESENRQNIVSLPPHPTPELIVMTGNLDGRGVLLITAGGKTYPFSVNRKLAMNLAKEAFATLEKMEPGK